MVEKLNTKQLKPVATALTASLDSSTYVLTLRLKDQNGNNLGSAQTIDLPLETMVVSGSYDDINQQIILVLKNGSTIEIPVGDLVSGLQTEITVDNKLPASLISGLNLEALSNVVITSATANQVLMYDATTQKWVNSTSTATVGFAAITGSPYDNTNLATALNSKSTCTLRRW